MYPTSPSVRGEKSLLNHYGSINSLLLLVLLYSTINSYVSHTYVLYILLLIAFIIRTQKLDPNKDPKDLPKKITSANAIKPSKARRHQAEERGAILPNEVR